MTALGAHLMRLRAVALALRVMRLRAVALALRVMRLRAVALALRVMRLRAVALALRVMRLRPVALALRGASLHQRLPEKSKAPDGIGIKRSSALDRDSAGVSNILEVAEKRFVIGIFAEVMRPDTSHGICEMKMHDLVLCGLDDAR